MRYGNRLSTKVTRSPCAVVAAEAPRLAAIQKSSPRALREASANTSTEDGVDLAPTAHAP
jgi:hypothetical protein